MPVFWLATEDHDFAEVNHCWVFDRRTEPVKLEMTARRRRASRWAKCGSTTPPIDELAREPARISVRRRSGRAGGECYMPGATMGEAFGALLRRPAGPLRPAADRSDGAGHPRTGRARHSRRARRRAGADGAGARAQPRTDRRRLSRAGARGGRARRSSSCWKTAAASRCAAQDGDYRRAAAAASPPKS